MGPAIQACPSHHELDNFKTCHPGKTYMPGKVVPAANIQHLWKLLLHTQLQLSMHTCWGDQHLLAVALGSQKFCPTYLQGLTLGGMRKFMYRFLRK